MHIKKLFCLCFSLFLLINLTACKTGEYRGEKVYSVKQQKANEILWDVKYEIHTKEIVSISAKTREADRYSIYWQRLADYRGDHAIYVTLDKEYNGVPLGGDWYKVEIYEKYSWDEDILHEQATRVEIKLVFEI